VHIYISLTENTILYGQIEQFHWKGCKQVSADQTW